MAFLIRTAGMEAFFEDPPSKHMFFAPIKHMFLVPINESFLHFRADVMINLLTDIQWKLHLRYFLKHHVIRGSDGMNDVGFDCCSKSETLADEFVSLESAEDGVFFCRRGRKTLAKKCHSSQQFYPCY